MHEETSLTRTTDSLEVKVNPGEKDDWMVTLCAVLGNILLSVENIGLAQWLRGKELTCSPGDTGDEGSIPRSGRSPGDQGIKATHSSILAWRIPRTEEPGGL